MSWEDELTRQVMKRKTYRVEHNPNCPSPYLVRLAGHRRAVIHGDGRDCCGYGKTVEEAFREAVEEVALERSALRVAT